MSIASEFRDEACDCRTPLFFLCRGLYKASKYPQKFTESYESPLLIL